MVSSSRMSSELVSKNHRLVVALLFDHVRLMGDERNSAMERSLPQDPRKSIEKKNHFFC